MLNDPHAGSVSGRVLILFPHPLLLPPRGGLGLRAVYLARALSRALDVELAAVGRPPQASRCEEPFSLVHLPGDWSRWRPVVRAAWEPWSTAQIRSGALAAHIASGRWDVIQASGLSMTRYLPHDRVSVFDSPDVTTDVAQLMAGVDSRRHLRPLWRREASKARRLEGRVAASVTAVTVPNEREVETFERFGARRIVVVPNGVDLDAIAHHPPVPDVRSCSSASSRGVRTRRRRSSW